MSAAVRLAHSVGLCLIFYFITAAQAQRVKEVVVPVGRRAVLTCDTSNIAFPDFDVTWERENGQFLSRGRNYVIEQTATSSSGIYVCTIVNRQDRGKVLKTKIDLRVVPRSSGIEGELSVNIKTMASDRLQLGGLIFRTCNVGGQTSATWTYTWSYPDGRTSESSMLYIPNLQAQHYGTYTCTAKNQNGQTLQGSFTFSSNSLPAAGRLQVKIRRISLKNPFVLECYVDGGSGSYSYEWRKGDKVQSYSQRLTISQLDAATSGSYECIVKGDSAGGKQLTGRSSDEVRVVMKNSQVKIALAPPPGPIHVVELGKTKELHCELDQTRATPEVAQWYFYPQSDGSSLSRRGIPVNSPQYTLVVNPSVSILVLQKLQMKDTGRYECIVRRDGRDMNREAFILVVSDAGLEVYPNTLTYVEGSGRHAPEFHCQVDNIEGGASSVRWSFIPRGGDSEVRLPSNVKLTQNPRVVSTSFLSVENPTMANAGFYVCRAPGNFEGRGQLIVKQRTVPVRLEIRPGDVVTVDPGQTARIMCFDVTRRIVPTFTIPRNVESQVRQETQQKNRILLFENVRSDQDGTTFQCHSNGQGRRSVVVRVNPGCPSGQRRCTSDRRCISANLFCNGYRDCADGSDESQANCAKCEPNEIECKANQGRAPQKKCVPVHWQCDGEDDCGNNFDEMGCTSGTGCNATLFQCRDGRQIPRGFHCDGEADCSDNDDEVGCIAPSYMTPTQNTVKRVQVGGMVTMMCEVIGTSAPKIVWRYMWGFLPDGFSVTSRCFQKTRATSTIVKRNVQQRDAGVYTCEALNNRGRTFGRDFVLEVVVP